MIITEDISKAFKEVRTLLGAPIRQVQLSDEQLCDILSYSISEYAEVVQNYIIENNWAGIYGKELSNIDLSFAFSTRSLDISKQYSQWFSKEVGLQQHGQWELKKDYFELERGRQVYVVPKGREINKVFWVTPPATNNALFATYGGFGVPLGGGAIGQTGSMGSAIGFSGGIGNGMGLYAVPFADIALMSMDLSYKKQFIQSDLVYKVTAGPDGTHLIHLLSTPGSKLHFGLNDISGGHSLAGCYCWYTYYDTTPSNVDECRRLNPDVLLSPDQVPLNELHYSLLNEPAKATVKKLLYANACEALGTIRGTFNGSINMINSALTMDYNMLLNRATTIKDQTLTKLHERMERLNPYNLLTKQSQMVTDLININKGVPVLPIVG